MKTRIDIDEKLMAKAQVITGITDKNILVEKASRLLIALESQKKPLKLKRKIAIGDEAYK